MVGGAWWVTVHGVAKSRTQLSNFTHYSLEGLLLKLKLQNFGLENFMDYIVHEVVKSWT